MRGNRCWVIPWLASSVSIPAAAAAPQNAAGLAPQSASAAGTADEGDNPNGTTVDGPAAAVGSRGLLLPLTIAPRLPAGTAFALARAGYDGAAQVGTARGALEGSLLPALALRVEFEHGADVPRADPDNRVRIGARWSLFEQSSDGLDAGLGLFYDPRDFRSEGNVSFGLLAARHFGRMGLFGNVFVGSDPEGDDQTLELRLASFYRAREGLQLGIDTRVRRNLSSDDKRVGTTTAGWDLEALPTLSWEFGHMLFVLDAGVRGLQTTGPFASPTERTQTTVGFVTLAGAGGVF